MCMVLKNRSTDTCLLLRIASSKNCLDNQPMRKQFQNRRIPFSRSGLAFFPMSDALERLFRSYNRGRNSVRQTWSRVALVFEGGKVESTLGFATRRELLGQMVPRYQKASFAQKGALLDEIAAITGYARRYAMWLLNHPEDLQPHPRRRRQRTFGPEVQHALFVAWQAANQI